MTSDRDALMATPATVLPVETRALLIAWMLRVGVLVALVAVVGRVLQLQIAPSAELSSFVESRTTTSTLGATRGDLLDRRGRTLATTRMGYSVVVDPEGLRQAMLRDEGVLDRVIVTLGGVLTTGPNEFAPEIISKIVRNRRVASAGQGAGAGTLSRYLRVGEVLNQEQAQKIRELKEDGRLPAITLEHEPVREQSSAGLLGPIVGKLAFQGGDSVRTGVLGAEKLFDAQLTGEDGSMTYVRDAKGRALWIERGAWIDADKGRDVRLSIDIEIQRIVREHLLWGMEQADAAGGRAIVIDPHTGEVLAMTDHLRDIPGLADVPWWDPDSGEPRPVMPAVEDQPRYRIFAPELLAPTEPALRHSRVLLDAYEPGSTFKPFAWTLGKSLGLMPDEDVLPISGKTMLTHYNRRISDVYTYPDLDNWDAVLRYSSNLGMYMATERIAHEDLHAMVRALGFGSRTGIGLGGENPGIVTPLSRWSDYTQTSVGMGYEVSVTPIQMARAFSVFARQGDMAGTLPQIRLSAVGDAQKRGMQGNHAIVERVFTPDAARRVAQPLTEVAQRMDKKMGEQYPDLPAPTYSMFGKSGTSQIAMVPPEKGLLPPSVRLAYFEKQHHSSFIVAAPAKDPQIVVLVVLDDIGPERVRRKAHYGSWVAGPVVRRIVEDTLPYLNVPADLGQEAHAQ